MSGNTALLGGRNVVRFVLISVLGAWLSGCSSDVTRLGAANDDPFTNPFGGGTPKVATSTPSVTSQALPGNVDTAYAVPAKESPYRAGMPPEPAPTYTGSLQQPKPQAVGGSAAGWSAVGGTPIVVGEADTVDSISRRFGVPAQALLGANGLKSAAQVHPGMHLILPIYNARGSSSAEPIPTASEPKKRHGLDSARADDGRDADSERPAKTKAKAKAAAAGAQDGADEPVKVKPKAKADKTAAANDKEDASAPKSKADKAKAAAELDKAKADKAAKHGPKVAQDKRAVDDKAQTTGRLTPEPSQAQPKTSDQADADGANPEFRWPARGRIILGYKDSGNDGINIAVPEGTSVRAAESGTVAYAGSALKGYGNLVLIKHPNGFVTAYANNGELDVKKGDTVKRGQVIAKSGQSGNVASPQLHFELRNKTGSPVDPTSYLAGL